MGGMVLETNMSEILTHIEAQNKLEKSEVSESTMFQRAFQFDICNHSCYLLIFTHTMYTHSFLPQAHLHMT